jgi:lipoprotein-anchoring transpeptidase ErfK/SrfK
MRSSLISSILPLSLKLVGAAVLALGLCQCTGVKKANVVVSVKEQRLGLYEKGELKKTYKISTSKFGIGDKPGSNCTPLGKCEVVAKIGHGLPAGAVLKSRRWNGEVLKPNAPGRDPIVSRILWLKGSETSNRNCFGRFIYIHGTPEERMLGKPASYGCIRMGLKDVVSVFNSVPVGADVVITPGRLPKSEGQPEAKAVQLVDESPSTATKDAKAGKEEPIEIAKIEADSKEKANAEKNLKAGPEKPATNSKRKTSSSSSKTASTKKPAPKPQKTSTTVSKKKTSASSHGAA